MLPTKVLVVFCVYTAVICSVAARPQQQSNLLEVGQLVNTILTGSFQIGESLVKMNCANGRCAKNNNNQNYNNNQNNNPNCNKNQNYNNKNNNNFEYP